MGVSILIPVYNTLIEPLARTLSKQAANCSFPCEIVFLDDCSDLSISYLNLKSNNLPFVQYEVLVENEGRAKIRNLLIEKSSYDKCIFLDGDMAIEHNDFIEKYYHALNENDIVVGGHYYTTTPPQNQKLYLHWHYGTKIECKTAEERQRHAYQSFMTGNFACNKSVFNRVQFNETIHGYGHEDTLFGIEAKRKGIQIKHIDNAALHQGLEPAEVFLQKQQQAVRNLKKLYQHTAYQQELKQDIRLIKYTSIPLLPFLLSNFKIKLVQNLLSNKPNLNYLQALKLIWWSGSHV